MGLADIAIRCLVAYGYLLLITRLKGKHAVAEATAFDFVMGLILGDLIDDLLWAEVPASQFMVAAGVLVLADTMVSLGTHYNASFYRWLTGAPRIVMKEAKAQRDALRPEQMNMLDLEHLLRVNGVERSRYNEVKLAILEGDGELSVIKSQSAKEIQREDIAPV